MIAEDWQKCLDIAKGQTRDAAHVLDLCVDYVGRDGVADMTALASRLATASTLPIAERLIAHITGNWGVDESSILIDTLTFTICTGQEESRKDGIETIRLLKQRHPDVQTTLGLSNISFGLNPAARRVLNSVFLHECQEAGVDSAIVHGSKILPMNRIDEKQREGSCLSPTGSG